MFWGLVASMYIGNVMLLVLNLPLVPVFAQLLRIPAFALLPIILGVSLVGVIAVSPTAFAGLLVAGFGLAGWLMKQWDYPAAPLVLGLVLGDPMERALRQSLMMSQGDLSILVSRPVSVTMLGLAAVVLSIPLARRLNAWRMRAIDS